MLYFEVEMETTTGYFSQIVGVPTDNKFHAEKITSKYCQKLAKDYNATVSMNPVELKQGEKFKLLQG